VEVAVDPGTAHQLRELRRTAATAGWRPGTPLLDTTFTTAVPLALDATVPPVLLPAFAQYGYRSVCRAVRSAGPAWRDAWLLVPVRIPGADLDQLASMLGRTGGDYTVAGTFHGPYALRNVVLLRPRPATPVPPVPGGCWTG
jgi:hypothetical protein